jgi:urease accessory protein
MQSIVARHGKLSQVCGLPLAALVIVALCPKRALAHLVTTGAGPFYDGVAHFFVSLDDLLVVVALALFSGLLGKPSARGLVLVLPVAWMSGMFAGSFLAGSTVAGPWFTSITLMLAGLMLAISPPIPKFGFASLACLIGFVHGIWNGAAMRATDTSWLATLGIVTSAWVVAIVLGASAVSVQQAWQKVALRVIGSWITAIGLLSLAWELRTYVN